MKNEAREQSANDFLCETGFALKLIVLQRNNKKGKQNASLQVSLPVVYVMTLRQLIQHQL